MDTVSEMALRLLTLICNISYKFSENCYIFITIFLIVAYYIDHVYMSLRRF